ncbi:MAG: hypothetical protein AABZ55_05140 [Bdellovibrionota bacterium]
MRNFKKSLKHILVLSLLLSLISPPKAHTMGWLGKALVVGGAALGGYLFGRSRGRTTNNYYSDDSAGGGGGYSGPSAAEMQSAIAGGIKQSLPGIKDAIADGYRMANLRLERRKLIKQLADNEFTLNNKKVHLSQKISELREIHSVQNVCAAFCGGLNENGQLVAQSITALGSDQASAFSRLSGQCSEGFIFRNIRMGRLANGMELQELVQARDETVCQGPITRAKSTDVQLQPAIEASSSDEK